MYKCYNLLQNKQETEVINPYPANVENVVSS